jgi:hypothetical protein
MTAARDQVHVSPPAPRPELAGCHCTTRKRWSTRGPRAHSRTLKPLERKLPQRVADAVAVMLLGTTVILSSGCGAAALSQRRHHVSGLVAAGQATYEPGPDVCYEENREDLCGNAVGFRWGYGVTYELVIWESRARTIAIVAELPLTVLHGARRFESAPDVPEYSGLWITPAPKLVLGRSKRGQFGVSGGPGWVRFFDDTVKAASGRSVHGTAWQFAMMGDWQLRPGLAVRSLLRVFEGRTPPEWAATPQPIEHSLIGAGLVFSF